MGRILFVLIVIVLSACSSKPQAPPKPPPTFEDYAAEIDACDKVETTEKPSQCSSKKFRLYRMISTDSPQYPRYKGKSSKDVINYLVQAKDEGHIGAHYFYTLHLMSLGDPEAYNMAVKTRELYQAMDIKNQWGHDISHIGPDIGRKETPEKEIEILVQRAEILDPEKGRQLPTQEIWSRLKPLTGTQNGKTYFSAHIVGIGSNHFVTRYLITSPQTFYPLFVRASDLGVSEATYHLAKVHFSRASTGFLNLTPQDDYKKYQMYMGLARDMNHPAAFMDKYELLRFERNLLEQRKAKQVALVDVKKAVDLAHPPAWAVWGKELKEKYTYEKNATQKAKLKEDALQHLLMAKRAGEKDLDKDILFLQDEKTFLAQERKAIEAWEANVRQREINIQKSKELEDRILNMLNNGQVTTQADVDFICANSKRRPKNETKVGDRCDWAQTIMAQRGLQKIRQQDRNSTGPWQGFTYTKETTDRYNKTVREGNEKREMDQFKKDLDYKVHGK